MICRTCLRRAPSSLLRSLTSLPIRAPVRPFSTTLQARNAAAAPAVKQPTLTPLTPDAPATPDGDEKPVLSSCLPGTKLNGLNYFKGKEDPLALADDAYPAWLWDCLEVQKKTTDAAEGVDDEFSKSRKTRRLAAKRKAAAEAKMLASGNLEALVPKVPLQKQSVNLPGDVKGGLEEAVAAAEKREELRKALRKQRKAGIKESNYLKTM